MENSIDPRIEKFRSRLEAFLDQPMVRELRRTLRGRACHLVGGALRDIALGHRPRDLDLVVAGEGKAVADELARTWGCRSIRLGGDRFAAYRVTRSDLPVDVWDRRATTLDDDLLRRDFRIHSVALDLGSRVLYDPFGGLADLASGLLRATTSRSFVEDPLRVVRLCRFAAQLESFRIEPATLQLARDSVADLRVVATERTRAEIEWTLEAAGASRALDLWVNLGLIPDMMLRISLSEAERRESRTVLSDALSHLASNFARLPIAGDLVTARLGLLLIEVARVSGTDPAVALATLQEDGYLTKRRAKPIALLFDLGPLPLSLAAQRWFLHRAGELWPTAVSLMASRTDIDIGEEPRAEAVANLVELATQRPEEIFDPPPLVDGMDLQRRLSLMPGALLGRILAAIRRQQIEGTITTTSEALELAARIRALGGVE